MRRAHFIALKQIRTTVISLLLLSVTGCGVWDGLFGSGESSVVGSGAQCMRSSAEDLQAILRDPPSCTGPDAVCPAGTFCAATGTCSWQCAADSDCPTGRLCSCDGRCLDPSQVSDAGALPDPVCPKNPTLLSLIQPNDAGVFPPDGGYRACSFDDVCPHGAVCDRGTGRCSYQCQTSSECPVPDGGTAICNCYGQCQTGSPQLAMPARELPSLSMAPSFIELPRVAVTPVKPDFEPREIRLAVTSVVATVGDGGTIQGPPVALHVAAGKFLEVACPAGSPDDPLGAFAKECVVGSTWIWTKVDDSYRATTTIKVKPSAEVPGNGELSALSWTIKVSSADLSNAPLVASIAYGRAGAPADPVAVTSLTAGTGYRGVLEFIITDQTELGTPTNKPETTVAAVPVTALAGASEIRILDIARLLTASGVIKVPLGEFDSTQPEIWTPEATDVSGRFAGFVFPTGTTKNPDTNALTTRFQVLTYTGSQYFTVDATARLVPDETVAVCAASGAAACPTGFQCTPEGFCSIDPVYRDVSFELFPTVDTATKRAWLGSTDADTASDEFLVATSLNKLTEQIPFESSADIRNFQCGLIFPFSSAIGVRASTVTGNIACDITTGESDQAIPLITQLDTIRRFQINPMETPFIAKKSAPDLFGACMTELARRPMLRVPPTNPPPVPFPDPWHAALQNLGLDFFATDRNGNATGFSRDVSCVSLGNFFASLKSFGSILDETNITRRRRNDALYGNVLRLWAEMHGFIARQGMQDKVLDGTLSAAKELTENLKNRSFEWQSQVTTTQLLDTLENGWAVLAGEGPIVALIDADVLTDPDPLRHAGSVTAPVNEKDKKPFHDRRFGLAPALLEFESAHLSLVEKYLQKINLETYEQSLGQRRVEARERALSRAGAALRGAMILLAMGRRMHEEAASPCFLPGCFTAPPWEERWLTALQEFRAARARLVAISTTMAAQGNPLGIEEGDLPLFFGDPIGTNSRFFASSDYLLNQWAAPAAASASAALNSAREAWISSRNSVVQDTLLKADQERRIEQIQAQFGRAVIENCGLDIESKDVFTRKDIDPQTCFVNPACPGAHVDVSSANDLAKQLKPQIIKLQLCKFEKLRRRQGITFPPEVEACLQTLDGNQPSDWAVFLEEIVGVDPHDQKVSCYGTLFENSKLWGTFGQDQIPLEEREAIDEACEQALGHQPLPVHQIDPACFRGRMGEATSRIVAVKSEVNTALARLQVAEVSATEQQGQCEQMMGNTADRAKAHESLEKIRERWAKTKKVARDVSLVTDTIQSSLAMVGTGAAIGGAIGSVVPGPGTLIGAGVGAAVGGLVGYFKSKSNNAGQKADDQLRSAESSYADLIQNQSRSEEIRRCWGEFHTRRAAIEVEASTIEARAADVNTAIIQLNELLTETGQQLAEGRAATAREKDRPFNGYAHHYWQSEKTDRFNREFAWAKRLTYLAMRAVEYDFQESLNLRTKILTAEHPDQLLETIEVLHQTQAARTINRRRPEESSLVVSLRDDVMRIADRSNAPPGERAWSPALRFRGRLSHPEFAVHDGTGAYLGQGVPFALDRLTGTGQGAVALNYRCGERMWRVTATIQGDGLSEREPGAPVFLLKRNTFSSQWCDGHGDENTLQTSSLQPSRQLFRPSDATAPVDQGRSFTASVLYPWFNIRRADFYKKMYQEGASEELAGRGLYGDYVLLFPKELISKGFPIDRVEDVLMRVDYLSIDNLPDLDGP